MDMNGAMKRLALWALVARTSNTYRRFERAMGHGITLENTIGLSVMDPTMEAAHDWAERTYGDKARTHADWGML